MGMSTDTPLMLVKLSEGPLAPGNLLVVDADCISVRFRSVSEGGRAAGVVV